MCKKQHEHQKEYINIKCAYFHLFASKNNLPKEKIYLCAKDKSKT